MKYFINTNRKIYILSTLAILLFTCCQNGKTKKENEEADSIEYVSALTEISEALGQQQLFEPGTASFNGMSYWQSRLLQFRNKRLFA